MAGRFTRTIDVMRDEVGVLVGAVEAKVDALADASIKIVGSPISIPEIDGTFPATFRRDSKRKGGVYVTLAFLIPSGTRLLIVKAIRTADRTDAATFRANKFSYSIDDIDDTERAAQRVVRELWAKDPLEYVTQYDVFRLAAFADSESTEGTVIGENPQVDVLFNDVALYQFTTPQVFNLPSDPNASLITTLLDVTTRAFDATTTFRVNAPLTDAAANQSWRDSGANEVVVVLTDPDGKTIKVPHYLNDTELDQVSGGRGFVDVTHKPEFPGGLYTWVRNICWVTSQKRESSGAAVQYRAANLVLDPTGLTAKSLSIVTSVAPYTPKAARVDLLFTNPASPNTVSLKNVTVERKIFGAADSTYQVIIKKFSLKDDEYSSAGAKVIVIGEGVVFKPSLTYDLRVTIFAIGGSSVQFTTGAVSTGASAEVDNDTAAPIIDAVTGVPIFEFDRGKFFCKLKLASITNWNNPIKVEISITNNSTRSLNIDDLSSTTPASGVVFYDIGKTATKINVPIPREQLHQIFGTSGTIRCFFRITNGFTATPTVSPSSALMDLATLKDVTTLWNSFNMLKNGHWTFHDGTNAKKWNRYDPRSGALSSVDTTGRLEFDLTEHRVKWRNLPDVDNQRFLLQNLGKVFMRSEFYSMIWNFYSNGTLNIDEIRIGLWTVVTLTSTISTTNGSFQVIGTGFITTDNVKVGAVIGNGTEWRSVTQVNSDTLLTCDRAWGAGAGAGTSGFALIPQSELISQTNVALSTVDLIQKGTIQTHTDLDTAKNIYFGVVFREIIGTVTVPYMDAICMNPGRESAGYQRSVDSFETNDAGTSENFDSQPTGGSSSGNQQLPGTGPDPGDVYNVPYL